jgi:diguanylate cyclase
LCVQGPSVGFWWPFVWRFLVIFCAVGAVVAGAVAVFYRQETHSELARILDEDRANLRLQTEAVSAELRGIVADLACLAESRSMRALLEGGGDPARADVAADFLNLARHHPEYDKVRFLDETGMEVIRINGKDGAPEVVSRDRLQSKANRYFFIDTFRLDAGKTYVSPFDLNVEHDAIELPFKPTIRFGSPVFDAAGRKRGVVLLNYLGSYLVSSIKRIAATSRATPELLNADGYWLSSPNPSEEWGFIVPGRSEARFGRAHPGEWERILRETEGAMIDESGGLTFTTLHPASQALVTSTGSPEIAGQSARTFAASSYTWKLVSRISPDVLGAKSRTLRARLLGLLAALFPLIGLASWSVAWGGQRRAIYRERIHRLALSDALTGLPNRTLFMDRFDQTLRQSIRYRQSSAVLFADLDGFKTINDTLGHAAGDLVLKSVAERMVGTVRGSDTVARLGGDEFTVLLTRVWGIQDALLVAERLMIGIRAPFDLGARQVKIGVSIGIAVSPDHGVDCDTLLSKADHAMYEAKRAGKNCCRSASPARREALRLAAGTGATDVKLEEAGALLTSAGSAP